MSIEWKSIKEYPLPPMGRFIICRNINGNKYVDMIAYLEDDPAGLQPYPTLKFVTHWMVAPEPPEDN